MIFQKTTFTRLFPIIASNGSISFGFESDGKRFYDITVPTPAKELEQGMTVIALLKSHDAFYDGFLGWIDCRDGSIVYSEANNSASYLLFLILAYCAITYPIYISHAPSGIFIATMLGGYALWVLYNAIKAHLVERALLTARYSIKPELGTDIAVVKEAPLPSGLPARATLMVKSINTNLHRAPGESLNAYEERYLNLGVAWMMNFRLYIGILTLLLPVAAHSFASPLISKLISLFVFAMLVAFCVPVFFGIIAGNISEARRKRIERDKAGADRLGG